MSLNRTDTSALLCGFQLFVDYLCVCSSCYLCVYTLFCSLTWFLRCAAEVKDGNFYSSDSDFDDEEPKKFHIQIRPVATSSRSNSAANELELKATVGALTLPPNRSVRVMYL